MVISARDDRIFRIIDSVLKQVFGENTTLFINEYLEQRYYLQQRDFSKKCGLRERTGRIPKLGCLCN